MFLLPRDSAELILVNRAWQFKLAKHYLDMRHNAISYGFLAEISEDPTMSPRACWALLTGRSHRRYAREANQRREMPATAFHGIKPRALRPARERKQLKAYEKKVANEAQVTRAPRQLVHRPVALALQKKRQREEEDAWAAENPEAAAQHAQTMKRLDENMSRPVIETAADGTVTLSAHHRIGKRKSKKDQQKWAEGIAAAVDAMRRDLSK